MMEQGLLAEVEKLFARGDLHGELPSMRAVGYRQLWDYLAGRLALAEAVQAGVMATRHLARRQLIWLRGESQLEWIDGSNENATDQVKQRVATFLH
jgi:tRNA dimethylallyltransferase